MAGTACATVRQCWVCTLQLRKHVGSGSACVQDVHRGCALPENDSGCAPTARLLAESSDIYSRSTPPSNFEIGSKEIRRDESEYCNIPGSASAQRWCKCLCSYAGTC